MKRMLILFILFIPLFSVKAEYMLPYPGPMPGNKLYKISRVFDSVQRYWHWGDLAQAMYYMNLSDKYLVESKILFEYKQYLLAIDALRRSNEAWNEIAVHINSAEKNGKSVLALREKYKEQQTTHQHVLEQLQTIIPAVFLWSPEKNPSTELQMKQLLEEATNIRLN